MGSIIIIIIAVLSSQRRRRRREGCCDKNRRSISSSKREGRKSAEALEELLIWKKMYTNECDERGERERCKEVSAEARTVSKRSEEPATRS